MRRITNFAVKKNLCEATSRKAAVACVDIFHEMISRGVVQSKQ